MAPGKRKTVTMPSPKNGKADSTAAPSSPPSSKSSTPSKRPKTTEESRNEETPDHWFVGEPVPPEDARRQWPKRYQGKKNTALAATSKNLKDEEEEEVIQAKCHYTSAIVDRINLFNLYDDAHVEAGEGLDHYVGKIIEMFEGIDGELYFTAQWYYRSRDTVIRKCFDIDPKRVFYSEDQNTNPLDCLVEKIKISRLPLNIDLDAKRKSIPACDYYCDTFYLLPYHTFTNLPAADDKSAGSDASSTISSETDINGAQEVNSELVEEDECNAPEIKLLDIYSGCGAMSTGLCLGANLAGSNLVTRWAVDLNEHACKSLELNHPEMEVRNEYADDFLSLLREYQKLCMYFNLISRNGIALHELDFPFDEDDDGEDESDNDEGDGNGEDSETFEVEKIIKICYGDPREMGKRGLYFKVHWKGYGPDEDSWEPLSGMGTCKEVVKQFVTQCFNSKKLPLPGDVDVICGGPPCQGISGFNRFRDNKNPLRDEKNKQLVVFMDLVQFLKPRFVLMENVVDLVKFSDGFLGRYAMGCLVNMNYQARMGLMAAGAYGLPQFRMRVFLWGANPAEKLPSYPFPTHDVVVRGVTPNEFESCVVAYDEGKRIELEKKLFLEDAISDLPEVGCYETREEIPYEKPAQTEFQRVIRMSRDEMMGSPEPSKQLVVYDHRPLQLNEDDYARVCQVPKKKGANFRDFPGVRVRDDNKVEWDPDVERVKLPSGKPLVPDYAMSFVNGTSSKPFARLWWDETVPTVVTRAEPHNQAIIHPVQDRVLTVRENARLQGFPDYYRLFGPIKQRYMQVGNAVAIPVSRALGYALGLAIQGSTNSEPLITLPPKFPDVQASRIKIPLN